MEGYEISIGSDYSIICSDTGHPGVRHVNHPEQQYSTTRPGPYDYGAGSIDPRRALAGGFRAHKHPKNPAP